MRVANQGGCQAGVDHNADKQERKSPGGDEGPVAETAQGAENQPLGGAVWDTSQEVEGKANGKADSEAGG